MRLSFSIFLLAAVSLGASYRPGRLLDRADQKGRSYFCVEARDPDRILIGYAKRAKGPALSGRPVLVKYDDQDVWLRAPHGRTLRLRQDYLTRAFAPGSACELVVEAAWKRINAPPKKLLIRDSH